MSGPVFVEGAEPGDTLQVDVLAIATADWGWTAVIPGFGLLADEYPEPALKLYEINKAEGYAWFDEEKGIRIPIRPFAGEMGVMRGIPGAFSTIPPYNTGVCPNFSHKIGFLMVVSLTGKYRHETRRNRVDPLSTCGSSWSSILRWRKPSFPSFAPVA